MNILENDIDRILVPEEEVASIENRKAKQISEDYAAKNLILLCIL